MTNTEIEELTSIAEQMEQEAAAGIEPAAVPYVLRGFARQLTTLARASKPAPTSLLITPELQHRQQVELARKEIREQNKNGLMAGLRPSSRADIEEDVVGNYVILRGGTNHGTSVPGLPADAPVGAFVCFGGEAYKLAADRNFDYDEEETKKLKRPKLTTA